MSEKKSMLKKTLVGAALLATSPAWAKGSGGGVSEGGKSQLGVNHLSLDVAPGYAASVCATQEAVETGKTSSNMVPNDISIAINPFDTAYVELVFTVRDIIAQNQNHVVFLVYSPRTSPSPQIPTPQSMNKLEVDMSGLEILAMYSIPAQAMLAQGPTRLGAANPSPHSALSFSVNLDTGVLPTFMRNNEKAYLQAGLMTQEAFDNGQYDQLILSELDTLSFVESVCPDSNASIEVDDAGTMTVTDFTGETGKTVTATASAESSIIIGSGKGGGG